MTILLTVLFAGLAFLIALQSQQPGLSLARTRKIRVERPRRSHELARVRRHRTGLAA